MEPIAIIGGTGFSNTAEKYKKIQTDYGDVNLDKLNIGGKDVYFLARHQDLDVPHTVNNRANIQALKLENVKAIYSVTACGRLAKKVWPGHLGIVTDVDWDDLKRDTTFAENGLLLHASMSEPFHKGLGEILHDSYKKTEDYIKKLYENPIVKDLDLEAHCHAGGTYFNIQGPAFATPAREARLRKTVDNAKFIGQTLVPEVHLAREMGIPYATLAMCVDHSNYPGASTSVKHTNGVMKTVQYTSQAARQVLEKAIANTPSDFHDPIHISLKQSIHPNQVNLERLRMNNRPNLAKILEKEIVTR